MFCVKQLKSFATFGSRKIQIYSCNFSFLFFSFLKNYIMTIFYLSARQMLEISKFSNEIIGYTYRVVLGKIRTSHLIQDFRVSSEKGRVNCSTNLAQRVQLTWEREREEWLWYFMFHCLYEFFLISFPTCFKWVVHFKAGMVSSINALWMRCGFFLWKFVNVKFEISNFFL